MKKPYILSAIVLGMLIGFQSCTKESPGQMLSSPDILKATITANQPYQLSLDNSVSIGILKQASHFQVSQTELDTNTGLMTYKYVPALNYTGTDEVVLSTIKATAGARTGCSSQVTSNDNITYTTSFTTLKINITGN